MHTHAIDDNYQMELADKESNPKISIPKKPKKLKALEQGSETSNLTNRSYAWNGELNRPFVSNKSVTTHYTRLARIGTGINVNTGLYSIRFAQISYIIYYCDAAAA